MPSDAEQVRAALVEFGERGAFSEESYGALKRAVSGAARVSGDVIDGFVALFFERHVLDDVRRRELIAMDDVELLRAVRHRFRQVVAGASDAHDAWHALSAHVRDALASLLGPGHTYPVSITGKNGFSSLAVEQAVAAFWGELGTQPTAREATAELMTRYVKGGFEPASTSLREFPAVIIAKLDAHRMATGILAVLSDEEKALLRHQLDGVPVETWAEQNGVSRATAYRMLTRIKSLCRVEVGERTNLTRLEVLAMIRDRL